MSISIQGMLLGKIFKRACFLTAIFYFIISSFSTTPVFAEGNPFVPTTDMLGTGLTAQVGGVELTAASQNIANFTDITGAYYDAVSKRIVFFGTTTGTDPKYSKDDMAVAIKSIFYNGQMPDVNIGDDPNNPGSATAIVSYTGPIQNTNIGSVLFNSDYKLKQYVIGYDSSNAKITSGVTTYKSVVDRYVALNPNPALGNQTKFILSPQNVTLKNSTSDSVFVFTTLSMQITTQQVNPGNDPKWNQATLEFAADVTTNYDQYGQETSSFVQAKQFAKIVAILKWISDNNIPTDFHWAKNYSPDSVSTPIVVDKAITPVFPNGYSAQGQVSFMTPNNYIPDDGTATSLKNSAQAGSTSQEDVVWTFTNGGQQYQAVAVAAKAIKSLGGYSNKSVDISIPIAGDLNLAFERAYSSFGNVQLGIGKGWDMMPARLYENLFPEDFNITICNDALFFTKLAIDTPNGHETFTYNCPGGYSADDPSFHSSLVQSSDFFVTVVLSDQQKYKFNPEFQLVSITDKNGNAVNYTYDSSGKLTAIADTKTHKLTVVYNNQNLVSSITDWSNRKVQYTYDGDGRLTGVIDPNGNTTIYGYDGNSRLSTIIDRIGQVVLTNTYNSDAKIVTQKNAAGIVKTNSYDNVNRIITQTDSNARVVKTTYDPRARILKQVDPFGNSMNYTYGNESVPITQTDRNNNKTSFIYDPRGNVTSVLFPDDKTVTYTYDNGNRITKMLDSRYGSTLKQIDYTYDTKGNQLQRLEAGSITRNTYDATGEVLTATDPLNRVTTWTRDSLGNILTEKDAMGNTTLFEYDTVGRPKKSTDADGKAFSQTFDANGNVLTLVSASGITNNIYDKENRLVKIILPNNTTNQYLYNTGDSLASVTDALGNVTSYSYNLYQNLLSQTDVLNKVTTHTYDLLNRHIEEKTPMGNTSKFEYDANGNITKRIDSLNRTTIYTYDAFNRVIKITYPDTKTVVYEYDNRGNKIKVIDQIGTTTYTYDIFDRMTQATNPYGKIIKYEYDKADNLTKLTYPDNKIVLYTYDNNHRMISVKDWNGKITTYTYNKNNTLATRKYPNTISTKYTYDASNRLSVIEHKKGTTIALKLIYIRDAVGNVIKITPSGSFTSIPRPITYTYDALGRVVTQASEDREGDRVYTYDKAGNILAKNSNGSIVTYTYDDDYRLTSYTDPTFGTYPQAYDSNGNLVFRRVLLSNFKALAYDFDNRLIKFGNETFKYDGDGNRLEYNQTFPRRFVDDVSGSLSRVLVETSLDNVIDNWFVYGLGIISEGPADTYRDYYVEDGLGNTKVLTNRSGLSNRMSYYDAFGEVQWGDNNRYGFVGQEYDESLDLNYMRARYYDPAIGRFITRDPVKGNLITPQSQHPYQYSYNNPVNLSDPSGEQMVPPQIYTPIINFFSAVGTRSVILFQSIWRMAAADGDATNELKFLNNARLLDHFGRHAKGLGYKNLNDYLKGASNLFKGGKGIQTYTKIGGDKLFYNSTTNEFGILSKDNVIRTYYSPDKGLKYYLGEIAKDKANQIK